MYYYVILIYGYELHRKNQHYCEERAQNKSLICLSKPNQLLFKQMQYHLPEFDIELYSIQLVLLSEK